MILLFGSVNEYSQLGFFSEDIFPELGGLNKRDCLVFYAGKKLLEDEKTVPWLEKRPYTTLMLDGDREVFELFKNRNKKKKYNGNMHKLSESVFHFADSGVYVINNKKVLVSNIGFGAHCLDPDFYEYSKKQFKHLMMSLNRNHNKVDLVFSVIPPPIAADRFFRIPCSDINSLYMDKVYRNCEYGEWYFSYGDIDADNEELRMIAVHRLFCEIGGELFTECSDEDGEYFDDDEYN